MLEFSRATWLRLVQRICRVTGDRAAAEDAVQAAYVRLQSGGLYETARSPQGLLARTAINIAIDDRRREARMSWAPLADLTVEVRDDEPLQDEVLAARERLRVVGAALDRLPQRTRASFLMQRIDGLKYREIAVRLGISQSAVEKHIARAALALSDAVEGLEQSW